MSSPLRFVDSEDEGEIQAEPVVSPPRSPIPVDSLQGIAKSIKGVRLSPELGSAAALPKSPTPAQRRVKTTPKARLRHDDSQIQFAAIESSPLQPEPVESQYMTDRQKEVKERQCREAAAMFPEIRSSPRTTSRPIDYNLPQLVLKSTQDRVPKPTIHEDSSPTYPPDALMSEFLGSSPTPSAKRLSDRRSDDDPPSSPPVLPPEFQTNHLTGAPLANADHGLVQETANAEQNLGNHFAEKTPPGMKSCPRDGESNGGVEDAHTLISHQKRASNLNAPQTTTDPPPVSEVDIDVDAPSEPSLDQPSAEHGDIQPNSIAHSSQSENSSHFSVEDEQVTAQLITEMERASSQQLAKQDETAQSSRGDAKKRKRNSGVVIAENKKKRTSLSSTSQVAADVPMAGETVADCVMIDVREADRSRAMLPQKVKREPSASPSMSTNIQAIEEMAVTGTPPVDHPMRSAADQSLHQEQDTPNTVKKAIGRPRGSRNSQVKQEEAEQEQPSGVRKSTRVSDRLSGSTTSSPHNSQASSQESTKGGPWLALGKTPRRGMFKWLQRSSADFEEVAISEPTASAPKEKNAERISGNSNVQDAQRDDPSPASHQSEHQSTSHNEGHESSANQGDDEMQAQGRGGFDTGEEEEEAATAQGILEKFHSMLDNIKRVTFGPEEERAVVGMLFECVKEVHEAGRRHISM